MNMYFRDVNVKLTKCVCVSEYPVCVFVWGLLFRFTTSFHFHLILTDDCRLIYVYQWESPRGCERASYQYFKSPSGIQKMLLCFLYSYDFLTFHPKGILVEIIHICGPIPDSTGIYEINSRRKFFSRFRILIYLLFIIFSSWGGKYIMCFCQIFNSPQKKLPKTLSQYVWSKSILYSLKSFEIHHSFRLSGSMEHTMYIGPLRWQIFYD